MSRKIFYANHDLLLLEEVNSVNPFFQKDGKKAWVEIADALNKVPDQMFGNNSLDARACELRVKRLLESYKADDVRNRSKSGTEEQYKLIHELLAKINAAYNDRPKSKEENAKVKAAKNVEKAAKEAELAVANEEIMEAGETTYAPQFPVLGDEMSDEAMVSSGGLDPRELNRGIVDDDDSLNGDHAKNGKKQPAVPERRKRKLSKDVGAEDENLISYLKKNDEEKGRIRTLEFQNKKDLREMELKSEREIKQLELAHQMEMEEKRQETEKLRIASEDKKWEAILTLISRR